MTGLILTGIERADARADEPMPITVNALVATGALNLSMPWLSVTVHTVSPNIAVPLATDFRTAQA